MFQRLRKECQMLLRFQTRGQFEIIYCVCNKVIIQHLIKSNSKELSQIEWVEEWMGGEYVQIPCINSFLFEELTVKEKTVSITNVLK